MPRKGSQYQRPERQARSVGPLELPVWQVFESRHQPHEPRPTQPLQLELVRHGSVGSAEHWLPR